MTTWTINSLEELHEKSGEILAALSVGQIYGITGNLGAGKTTLVSALLKTLGYHDVSSPTFSLVQYYDSKPAVYHMDLYRLDDEQAVDRLDLEYYFSKDNCYFFVEWPDKLKNLGYDIQDICIKKIKNQRIIELKK
jgi:tRNA threonylcarbamoyladenosine biosynthesis protein TsaE